MAHHMSITPTSNTHASSVDQTSQPAARKPQSQSVPQAQKVSSLPQDKVSLKSAGSEGDQKGGSQ
jgi:hypothetical protein